MTGLGFPIGARVFGGFMGDLSEHFSRKEFMCPCGCGFGLGEDDVSPELIERLEHLRAILARHSGGPMIINSGCRCADHNRKIGGVRNSQHLRGCAADIRVIGVSPERVQEAAESVFSDGGLGYYKTFTHVDVRGHRARWGKE